MIKVKVKADTSKLEGIIKELPRAVDKAVDDEARDLAAVISRRVWLLRGFVKQASVSRVAGSNHAEVWCGFNRGMGFYSRFNEWGTIYQAPRPVVGPAAHEHEPKYAKRMGDAVRDACR